MIKLKHIFLILFFSLPFSAIQAWNPFSSLWNKFNDNITIITTAVTAASITFLYTRYIYKKKERKHQEQTRKLTAENNLLQRKLETTEQDNLKLLQNSQQEQMKHPTKAPRKTVLSKSPTEHISIMPRQTALSQSTTENISIRNEPVIKEEHALIQKSRSTDQYQILIEQLTKLRQNSGIIPDFLNKQDVKTAFESLYNIMTSSKQNQSTIDQKVCTIRNITSPGSSDRPAIGGGGGSSRGHHPHSTAVGYSIQTDNEAAFKLWLLSSNVVPKEAVNVFYSQLMFKILTTFHTDKHKRERYLTSLFNYSHCDRMNKQQKSTSPTQLITMLSSNTQGRTLFEHIEQTSDEWLPHISYTMPNPFCISPDNTMGPKTYIFLPLVHTLMAHPDIDDKTLLQSSLFSSIIKHDRLNTLSLSANQIKNQNTDEYHYRVREVRENEWKLLSMSGSSGSYRFNTDNPLLNKTPLELAQDANRNEEILRILQQQEGTEHE